MCGVTNQNDSALMPALQLRAIIQSELYGGELAWYILRKDASEHTLIILSLFRTISPTPKSHSLTGDFLNASTASLSSARHVSVAAASCRLVLQTNAEQLSGQTQK
jgi:hypothetical protein